MIPWHVGTWFSGELGNAKGTIGLERGAMWFGESQWGH